MRYSLMKRFTYKMTSRILAVSRNPTGYFTEPGNWQPGDLPGCSQVGVGGSDEVNIENIEPLEGIRTCFVGNCAEDWL